MKKLLVLVLATVLVAASLAGCTSGGGKASGTLIVGTPAISGDFIDGFGNSSYDRFVKVLTNGYNATYAVTPEGEYVLNETVVKDLQTSVDGAGNKTYTFEIHNDLKWNNGDTITAEDYVFTVLWYASPYWVAAGAGTSAGQGLIGYNAYNKDDVDRFAGVKLIDEFKFSLTIDAEELPYFYEVTYVTFGPIYKAGWASASEIDSNADGAKIVSTDPLTTMNMYAQRVGQTERFAPTVTAGPYKFVSFENNAVTLKINEHFKGNYEGKTPKLDTIIIRYINQTTDVDQCINGEVDAVTGVIEGAKIEKAMTADTTDVNYYPRNGFGGIFIHTDYAPVSEPNVRHALAFLMDRNEIIQHVLGGYGSVTNGHYGLAQWMYQEKKAEIDALPNFVLNISKANELLDATEWKFEADGKTAFTPTGTNFRHNSKGERLIIEHLGTEDNEVTDAIEAQLMANTPGAGIDWRVTRSDFAQLLDHYYNGHSKGADRKYHTFNLATGFTAAFDPYYSFHSDYLDIPRYNNEKVNDPELDELIIRMRSLDPTQTTEYANIWVEYQIRWNQLLPVIPLYSNQYYDVFRKEVKGFATTPFLTWAEIICDITKE